jgi:hypothetical protein
MVDLKNNQCGKKSKANQVESTKVTVINFVSTGMTLAVAPAVSNS